MSLSLLLLLLIVAPVCHLFSTRAQDFIHLHRRSSKINDDFLTLRLGQGSNNCETSSENLSSSSSLVTPSISPTSLIADIDRDGLLLLSNAADFNTEERRGIEEGEVGIPFLSAIEKKRRYNRERQRSRRAKFTPEQKRKELQIARESHNRRMDKMSVEEKVAYVERKRESNKMHYYEVVKPKKEERRLKSVAKDESVSDLANQREEVLHLDRDEDINGFRKVKRGNTEASHRNSGEEEASGRKWSSCEFSSASPKSNCVMPLITDDTRVDLELRLGSVATSSKSPHSILDARKLKKEKKEVLLKYVEHIECPNFDVQPRKTRALRATSWRAIPDAQMSSKQRWYASLTDQQRDEYRTRCRNKARERRDAELVEEARKRRENFRQLRLSRTEEDKKAYGAAYGPARREYCRRYYREVIKPKRDAMLAANSRYPLPISHESTQDESKSQTSVPSSSRIMQDCEETSEEIVSDNDSWQRRSNLTDSSSAPVLETQEEEEAARSLRDMSLTTQPVGNSEAVAWSIEHRSKRKTTWRDIPKDELSIDQILYEGMTPSSKEKYLHNVRVRLRARQESMTTDEKKQVRLRKNFLTRERYKKLPSEERRAYLAHRRLLYHREKMRKVMARLEEDKMEIDKQSSEDTEELINIDPLVKRSEPSMPNEKSGMSLDLSLGVSFSDNAELSSETAFTTDAAIENTQTALTEATPSTRYRDKLNRMTETEREAYIILRREAARRRRATMSAEKREDEKARDRVTRRAKKEEKKVLREQEFLKLKIGFDGLDNDENASSYLQEQSAQEILGEASIATGPKGGKCHRAIRKTKWRPDIPEELKTYSQLEYEKMAPEQKEKHREKSRMYQREKRSLQSIEEKVAQNEYMNHRRMLLPEAHREHIRLRDREKKRRQAAEYRLLLKEAEEKECLEGEMDESELLLTLSRGGLTMDPERIEMIKEAKRKHQEYLVSRRLLYHRKREKMSEEDLKEYRKARAAAQKSLYDRRKDDEHFKALRRDYQAKCRQRKKLSMMQVLKAPPVDAHDSSETEDEQHK